MVRLSKRQSAVGQFIAAELRGGRACPTHREIASHFGFKSSYAAACHVNALVRKGVLIAEFGKARALRLANEVTPRRDIEEIPVFGSIPAGIAEHREQEREGLLVLGAGTVGVGLNRNTFALRVVGESMVGRHICDGDIAILEHGLEPHSGQIVAALIDSETTLKTFVEKGGRPFLKAENPKYPDLIPSEELMIQGVFRGLIRKA